MLQNTTAQSAKATTTTIEGVEVIPLQVNQDKRGSFTEVFQLDWGTCIEPVQWSVVQSKERVFRGMHYHDRHDEYFCLIQGECYVGLKDLRENSSIYLQSSLHHFRSNQLEVITFPRGILHGWYFVAPSIHLQAVSEAYHSYGHNDNNGCHWSDPALDIQWPFTDAILSERASQFGSLEELLQIIKSFPSQGSF